MGVEIMGVEIMGVEISGFMEGGSLGNLFPCVQPLYNQVFERVENHLQEGPGQISMPETFFRPHQPEVRQALSSRKEGNRQITIGGERQLIIAER
ncbi:unnamed protein product [Penicillium roqueforti FM164]|uniref:Genomic scaffold, ProqFM164S01 n=1 Tax=Penicillium roqueforti (strain FM164) TaxID=1365484 RepID=W6PVN0_PENRF|nr:unnamed protein product [Penicillium roqueforti FM164]